MWANHIVEITFVGTCSSSSRSAAAPMHRRIDLAAGASLLPMLHVGR